MTMDIGFMVSDSELQTIQKIFGERVRRDVQLAKYTAARIGGPADYLLEVAEVPELIKAVQLLWKKEVPYTIIGGGSNILVSDHGVRSIVIINKCRQIRFDENGDPPLVWAESGANLGLIARQATNKGLSGLEWAAGIPGTLGGAVIGNAGAHGGDIAGNLVRAEVLTNQADGNRKTTDVETWTVEQFDYRYRDSKLKRASNISELVEMGSPQSVVLSAELRLSHSSPEEIQRKVDEYTAYRRQTQPPGASMGSMFKNPPGDYAGRLIEAAGLKGFQVGSAQISPLHANFFINQGKAAAADVLALLVKAQSAVYQQFGVELELEIELLGDFSQAQAGYDGG